MRVLLILFVVPAFALGLAVGATRVVGKPTAPAQATALVWANRVFTSGHELNSWLRSRGSSYEQWATRHPTLATTFPQGSERPLPKETVADGAEDQPGWWNALLAGLVIGSTLTLLLYLFDRRRPGIWARLAASGREAPVASPAMGGADIAGPPLLMKVSRALGREGSEETTHATQDWPIEPAGVALAGDPGSPAGERIGAFRRSWHSPSMRLARIGSGAAERSRAAAVVRRRLSRRIRRRYLPWIVFYAAAIVLAFAIGAAISSYLN